MPKRVNNLPQQHMNTEKVVLTTNHIVNFWGYIFDIEKIDVSNTNYQVNLIKYILNV